MMSCARRSARAAGKVSMILCGCAVCLSPLWIVFLILLFLGDCRRVPPNLTLKDVNIHNMVVYQNTTDSPYQVRSELSVNLRAWITNTQTTCFFTFRRMSVSVAFKGEKIVHQEAPLGFKVKPRETHTVMLELRGDGYTLKKESALLLDLELRNSSGMGLTFSFESLIIRKLFG